MWTLCDATNTFLCNSKVYIGKENDKIETNQGKKLVKILIYPYLNKGRNVTTDNFFTSLSLERYLL